MDFDFDHWATLATEDPERFERERAAALADLIDTAPEHIRPRLNGLQWQLDQIRAGSAALSERDTAVQTRINRTGGAPPLSVDWRVRESDGNFAIIDVVAEGVSLVVSQRNEVASIIERRGMDGLIETMRERSGEGETVL